MSKSKKGSPVANRSVPPPVYDCRRCKVVKARWDEWYCQGCLDLAKHRNCKTCKKTFYIMPEHKDYECWEEELPFACNDCIEKVECCTKCKKTCEDLLLCDNCLDDGACCLKCAGFEEVPPGDWFCSLDCLSTGTATTTKTKKKKRDRNDEDEDDNVHVILQKHQKAIEAKKELESLDDPSVIADQIKQILLEKIATIISDNRLSVTEVFQKFESVHEDASRLRERFEYYTTLLAKDRMRLEKIIAQNTVHPEVLFLAQTVETVLKK